ncbi:MAG: response regulator [Kamptonema sp. SIO4C4]|nr:response regulator [Kamptonema sp. SIO4C4]
MTAQKSKIIGYEGHRRKILIVDDHTVNRVMLVDVLQPLGFECWTATDGQEGITLAEDCFPDLVIADLVMAKLDGVRLTRYLRQHPQLAACKIIMTSASVLAQDQRKSLQAGCDAFLPKPIEIEPLLLYLQQYLDLVWVYEPASASEEPLQEWVMPSPSECQSLQYAARIGDFSMIETEIKRLRQLDERYQRFCDRVQTFATEFNDQAIQQLLDWQAGKVDTPHP